ncbi:MAG: alpha-L-fucosidase [Verrucomicrobiota bacterium]
MKPILTSLILAVATAAGFAAAPVKTAAPAIAETSAPRDARMAWWREARYGMFIHWDMSSMAGTEISWSRKGSKPLDITGNPAGYVEDPAYDNLYKIFNPTNFDATAWVKLAKAAGMKYLVFTAKHHGGFCMFDTKLTDYSIMHTPFKRDVVKELAEACRVEGLRFGIYYSQRDWHNPDYGIGDNSQYVAYMNSQVRELLSNYGTVDVLWWDSYGRGNLTNFWRIGETFDIVQQLQPFIVMNNRMAELGAYNRQPVPYRGDFDTPEQRLGKYQDTRLWESCMTVVDAPRGGWSYRTDGKVKSFEEALRMLVSCATGDGNLLLDVGPDSTGVIPADQGACLAQVGKWLKQYGESIYGTRGGPFKPGEYGGTTRKGKTIYVHVLKWPESGALKLPPVSAKLLNARLLCGGKADVKQSATELGISVVASDRQKTVTVVALEFDSDVMKFPAVTIASPPAAKPTSELK